MAKMPEPDSELESLVDFKSMVHYARPSEVRPQQKQILRHNFLNALVKAAKPAFSLQSVP
eukprot:CAMPEP_0170476200 /NCGR_PEP_ID=MMETSP0123-20130129/17677_1 /TAXON_ID=182087 /ORGANISM="Favella ehrenbergii, Strain Fehren 1" /LENGTH=59 /DNA_ID=CAMNT_0010747125 /DNA_START=152 /DNA_END=331 /DNA_ORIENTATION=-